MSVEDYKRAVTKKAVDYEAAFTTGPGKNVLKDLEETYVNIELFSSDPLVMASNVAARDVVVRIKNLMRVAQNVQTEDTVT